MIRKNWIVIGCVLAIAVLVCTVTYADKGKMKGSLPSVVQSAVKALFPKAAIENSKKEEMSIDSYEVELKDNGKAASMDVAEDGTVAEVETTEAMDALPAAVAQAIKAQDSNVSSVDKAVTYAELKLIKLAAPVTTYEAKITKAGKKSEIKISVDGKILKQEAMEKEHKGGKEKDEDEEHDEQ